MADTIQELVEQIHEVRQELKRDTLGVSRKNLARRLQSVEGKLRQGHFTREDSPETAREIVQRGDEISAVVENPGEKRDSDDTVAVCRVEGFVMFVHAPDSYDLRRGDEVPVCVTGVSDTFVHAALLVGEYEQ